MKLKLTFLSLLISLSSSQIQAGSNRDKIENALFNVMIISGIAGSALIIKTVYDLVKPNSIHNLIKSSEKERVKLSETLEKVLTQDLTQQELNELIDDLGTDEFKRYLNKAIHALEQNRNTSGPANS